MAVRFTQILELTGALVALDHQGRVWSYEPGAGNPESPWRLLPSPE